MKRKCPRLLALLLAGLCLLCACRNANVQPEMDVVRLHIIANSNADADQQIKYVIRERLLANWGDLLSDAVDAQQSLLLVQQHQDAMLSDVQACLAGAGMPYTASLQTGVYPFPTREYDGQTYPAGAYEAVRVVLGTGQGDNWWCVLFPPLCMVGADIDFDMDAYITALQTHTAAQTQTPPAKTDTPPAKTDRPKPVDSDPQDIPAAPVRSKILDTLIGKQDWNARFARWADQFWLE